MDAKHSLGDPRILISRRSLLHNSGVIRKALSPGVKICAMLKADAYGHGAAIAADTLCNFCNDGSGKPPADAVAVASIDEALGLPDLPVPVLIFRPVENAFIGRQRVKIEQALKQGWVLTLCSTAAADDLARIAMTLGRRALVQVMVDTGMTRSGALPEELPAVLQRVEDRPALKLWGVCTHFASADVPESAFTPEQARRFRQSTDALSASSTGRVIRHAANSGAIFFHPTTQFDMVRPGLSLYGIDPSGRPSTARPLRPACDGSPRWCRLMRCPPAAPWVMAKPGPPGDPAESVCFRSVTPMATPAVSRMAEKFCCTVEPRRSSDGSAWT